jgi:hypothetical protein
MGDPRVIDGHIHAPFFVFIRGWTSEDEATSLTTFGLEGYSSNRKVGDHDRYVTICDQGDWYQIADDWYYTLWHSRPFLETIRDLAKRHEVLLFMVGEADYSFEIEYHKAGIMQRQFIYDQPPMGTGRILSDVGTPFPDEAEIVLGKEMLESLWRITGPLGIPTRAEKNHLRVYSKPYESLPAEDAPWDQRIERQENKEAEQGVRLDAG